MSSPLPTPPEHFIHALDDAIQGSALIRRLEEESIQALRHNEPEVFFANVKKLIDLSEKTKDGWTLVGVCVCAVSFTTTSSIALELMNLISDRASEPMSRRCLKEMCCEAIEENKRDIYVGCLSHPLLNNDGVLSQIGVDYLMSLKLSDSSRVALAEDILSRIQDKKRFISQLDQVYPSHPQLDALLPVLLTHDVQTSEKIIEKLTSLPKPTPNACVLAEKKVLEESVDLNQIPVQSREVPRKKI